jgi:hypothetical protein
VGWRDFGPVRAKNGHRKDKIGPFRRRGLSIYAAEKAPLHSAHDHTAVILSGVAASLREAATQSKDLYHYENAYSILQQKFPDSRPESIYQVGVLRLHKPIRKRIGSFRSG